MPPVTLPPGVATRRRRRQQVVAALAAGLGLALVAGILHGSVSLGAAEVWAALIGWRGGEGASPQHHAIIVLLRLPRVLLAAVAGAALATGGAVLQGMFRNPLVDPGLLGVSSGAAVGAVLAIALRAPLTFPWAVPAAAFAGGTLAVAAVTLLARTGSRTSLPVLLLAGLVVSSLGGSVVSVLITVTQPFSVAQEILFWLMGSLHGRRWEHLSLAAPPALGATVALWLFARPLNLLLAGEEEAAALGMNVERLKVALLGLTALAVGSAVSVTGTIGFVGLMVPHLLRFLAGGDHRWLLPASSLGGATFLVMADLVARTALRPMELPVGVVTALVGVPFFLVLLVRGRREVGRW